MDNDFKFELVIDTIDKYVYLKKNVSEILFLLEEEFNYSIERLDTLFISKYKTTLISYIKRKRLLCAYEYWVNNGCFPLTERISVFNIKQFKSKFNRSFGCSPENAKKENYDLTYLMPNSALFNQLNSYNFISNFHITTNNVKLKFEPVQCLITALQMNIYQIPKKSWDSIRNSKMDIEEIKLAILTSSYILRSQKNPVKIPSEELLLLDYYNIYSPEVIDNVINFYPNTLDALHEVFEKEINLILPYLGINSNIYIPNDNFLSSFIAWRLFDSKSTIPNIDDFSKYCNKDTNETIQQLWYKCKIGLLRYCG
ncbi:hypothetical protein QYZ88_009090 [Lachnospiraceae bacterium C1.1]|nr:hypothetical protein [Lachnospiraceae bacterium C1.1]